MTSADEVLDRLRPLVAEHYGVDEYSFEMETSFIGDLSGGLYPFLELIQKVEEEFDIVIPEESKKKVDDIKQLVRLVLQARKHKKDQRKNRK